MKPPTIEDVIALRSYLARADEMLFFGGERDWKGASRAVAWVEDEVMRHAVLRELKARRCVLPPIHENCPCFVSLPTPEDLDRCPR